MSDRKESGSFLNRWSSRKQQSARRVVPDDAAPEVRTGSEWPDPVDSTALLSEELLQGELPGNDLKPTDVPSRNTAPSEDGTVQQSEDPVPVEQVPALLTDADMPDIQTLTASSDISGFLGKGVSAALRKAALRHVFRQPEYHVRDGLDDYDDDYTTFEPLGDTVTSDMKFHAARKERARLESERLAEEQLQIEPDAQVRADTAQDSTSTLDDEPADKPVEEASDVGQEDRLEDEQERHENRVAMAEDGSVDGANLSRTPLADQRPDTDNPLNKTSQANASQPNEIPE